MSWLVVVEGDASWNEQPPELFIGPYSSETRADNLARRINEGFESLRASVEYLTPVRASRDALTELADIEAEPA